MTDTADLEKRLREAIRANINGPFDQRFVRAATEAADALASLTRELEEAREALAPFAREAAVWSELQDDEALCFAEQDGTSSIYDISVGELRRAAAVHALLSTAPADKGSEGL